MRNERNGLYVVNIIMAYDTRLTSDPSIQFENSLRRHNHVGLIHALALALAKAGRLTAVTEQAKAKLKERVEKRQKEGKMEED